MLSSLLIANRGEIACRIIRTCRRLGVRSIAVYSEADRDAQHVRQADIAVAIGGARPSDSYLVQERLIAAALATGAHAIHPGYGFLSENAHFARRVRDAGLIFVGPDPESVDKMGSKADAKALMEAAGVPVVPGYHGAEQAPDRLLAEARRVGFPLMLKAAAGGGGKGMRIVRDEAEFLPALESAAREAESSFGDRRMILERYLERPRHIEFQVFGDRQGQIIHLGERECSAQRRYQKVLEETPSPFLSAEQRARMGAAAVAAARAVAYVGAGTVEFIVAADGEFFFMEMNTRLQVEHPVTEMVTGTDLVEWQLRVASGEPLPLGQDEIRSQGHSIEVRLYAEDPERGFLPGSGRLDSLRLPAASAHVRVDSGVQEGDTVSIFYDPMIAKLIVWDRDRHKALARLREALADTEVRGPASNVAFLEALAGHPAVLEGRIDTSYLDQHLDEFMPGPASPEVIAVAAASVLLDQEQDSLDRQARSDDPSSPWAIADAWRHGHAGRRVMLLEQAGRRVEISTHGHQGHYRLDFDGEQMAIHAVRSGEWLSVQSADMTRRYRCRHLGQRITVASEGPRQVFQWLRAYAFEGGVETGRDRLAAPMPGRIVAVQVAKGDRVEAQQALIVMEAMKMELTLRAPHAGLVSSLSAREGEFVEADTVLAEIEAGEP